MNIQNGLQRKGRGHLSVVGGGWGFLLGESKNNGGTEEPAANGGGEEVKGPGT